MTQVINGITVQSQYRDQGIPGCPPLATGLPMQHMAGITTQELIVFFPNHAFKVHAIGARILVEKFSQAEVFRLLHLSRGLGIDPPKDSVLTPANTIRVQLKACKDAVLRDMFRCGGGDINLVTHDQIVALAWQWAGNPRNKNQPLDPAWSLQEIAVRFPGNLLELPDMGPFTMLVKNAFRQYQDLQAMNPEVVLAPQADPPSTLPALNPPPMPPSWHLGLNSNFRAVTLFADANGSNDLVGSVLRSSRDSRRFADLGTILAQYDNSASRILHEAPHLIDGEVLLYFCAREGFCMTIAQIADYVKEVHLPSVKPIGKSAYSHRMAEALAARAKKNGTSPAHERELYINQEKHIVNANQTKGPPVPSRRMQLQRQPPAGYSIADPTLQGPGFPHSQPAAFDDFAIDPALLAQTQDENEKMCTDDAAAMNSLYDMDWMSTHHTGPYFTKQEGQSLKREHDHTEDHMEPASKRQRVQW